MPKPYLFRPVTKKQQQLEQRLFDRYHKFADEAEQRHKLTEKNIRLETWLRQKAKENSIKRFGKNKSKKRTELAELLRRGRLKDQRTSPHSIYGRWEITFDAGLRELNKFYRRNLIKLILHEKKGKKIFHILEIGAGTGRAAKTIKKTLSGVRYTATGLAKIPEFNKRGVSGKINWKILHSLLLQKKIPPNSVDFIHSNLGISYSEPENITLALSQCQKILRKGGKILFTCEKIPRIPRGYKRIVYHFPDETLGEDYVQHIFLLERT